MNQDTYTAIADALPWVLSAIAGYILGFWLERFKW